MCGVCVNRRVLELCASKQLSVLVLKTRKGFRNDVEDEGEKRNGGQRGCGVGT